MRLLNWMLLRVLVLHQNHCRLVRLVAEDPYLYELLQDVAFPLDVPLLVEHVPEPGLRLVWPIRLRPVLLTQTHQAAL